MILLTQTTDSLQIVTSGSPVSVDAHASFADTSAGAVTFGRQNTAITTSTTTTVLSAPASSTTRKLKALTIANKDAAAKVSVNVLFNDNGTAYELFFAVLGPNDLLQYIEGVGFFVVYYKPSYGLSTSTADQSVGASATATLSGSAISIDVSRPIVVGTVFEWRATMAKTAAGSASQTFNVRFGTTGGTGDTSRFSLATGTQTAAADTGELLLRAVVRGPIGASCVVAFAGVFMHNLASTGFAPTAVVVGSGTATFDVTTSGLIASVSTTTGASASVTVSQVVASVANI